MPQDEYIIAASPTNNGLLLITYTPVLEPGEYRIRLQAQDANGNISDTERTGTVAGEFEIKNIANFPNPFLPGSGTYFAYYLTESADEVSLKIYTITGQRALSPLIPLMRLSPSTNSTTTATIGTANRLRTGSISTNLPLAKGTSVNKRSGKSQSESNGKKIIVIWKKQGRLDPSRGLAASL